MFYKFTDANGWLAFELNVLRRLKFASALLPFSGETNLGAHIKRWDIRVAVNDLLQSAWVKAVASIQNNAEKLSDEDVSTILEDVYVPRYRLQNRALRNWFNETDAWWFDNARQTIEKLSSPVARAMALSIGIGVGDYALSFNEETRGLRQPLSNVFKQLLSIQPEATDNGQNNVCQNKTAIDFIVENQTDLMFLRLPQARHQRLKNQLGAMAWREEWLRGGDDFWNDLELRQAGNLGAAIETKHQYLELFEETLKTALHISVWAVAYVENGFVSTQDVVKIIGRMRRVDTVFTKDFSELTGSKAVIITA